MGDRAEVVVPEAQEDRPSPPPFPYNNAAGRAVANAGKPLAALNGDASEILARLHNGEHVPDIAKELGVSDTALYGWLIRNSPEEWKAISSGKALARIEKAEKDMDAAADAVEVAKARESHRMGAWTLERVARCMYGEDKGGGGVQINVVLDRSCGGAIDVTPA